MSAIVLAIGEKDPLKISAAINRLAGGGSNAIGTVTLTANAASTTVSALACAAGSAVFLFQTTAHAAAEMAAGGCYISATAKRSFTITHANNAQTDRTFVYVCFS